MEKHWSKVIVQNLKKRPRNLAKSVNKVAIFKTYLTGCRRTARFRLASSEGTTQHYLTVLKVARQNIGPVLLKILRSLTSG